MKWLSFLVAAIAGLIAVLPVALHAEPAEVAKIESISHSILGDAKEKITIKLGAFAKSNIFTMKGENPRLVIDLPNCTYSGKAVVTLPEGKLATAIRTAMHQDPLQKTRVVIDLAKSIPVGHTTNYAESTNTLVIEFAPDKIEQLAKEPAQVLEQKKLSQEPKKDVASDLGLTPTKLPDASAPPKPVTTKVPPVDTRPVPPVFAVKETSKEPSPALATTPEKSPVKTGPQLLGVSFDDSSNRGEMVLFHLTDFHPPTVSAVEKGNPRVLCDFLGMEMSKGVEENIAAKGKYVERIRTVRHQKPEKVQVVLELSPDRDYDLQQVFFKNDNLFVLIVNELPQEKAAK